MANVSTSRRDGGGDRREGARQFQRRDVHVCRHDEYVLQTRRAISRADRRSRRSARRLRCEIHLRRLSAAAVPGRVSGRTRCRRSRLPGMRARRKRAASAGFTSTRTNASRTTTSCTGRVQRRTGTSCAPTATRPACKKNYDAAADRFKTSWAEINVSCEACHGPGSRHLEWAEADTVRSVRLKPDQCRTTMTRA